MWQMWRGVSNKLLTAVVVRRSLAEVQKLVVKPVKQYEVVSWALLRLRHHWS